MRIGIIVLEIGYDQKDEIFKLVKEGMGAYKDIKCFKDLGENDRVIVINY